MKYSIAAGTTFTTALCLLATVALAACYVCGEYTCDWSGGTCVAGSTATVCENAPRDALNGEPGQTNLTSTQRNALCWDFSSEDSEDWAQRPCSAGPPTPGIWYRLGACGLATGQCCWTKVDFKEDGTVSNAGFQIQDCSGIGCVGPVEQG